MGLKNLRPQDLGDRIVIFAPHEDDPVISMAGLIRTFTIPVHIGVITNGEAGNSEPFRDQEEEAMFIVQRQNEALEAYATLGIASDHVKFFGFPDMGISQFRYWKMENRPPGAYYQLVAFLRKIAPTTIFVPNPDDWHDDHNDSFRIIAMSVRQAQNPNMGAETGQAIRVARVFAYGVWNELGRVTHTFHLDAAKEQFKIEALKCFRSQKLVIDKLVDLLNPEAFQEMPGLVMDFS